MCDNLIVKWKFINNQKEINNWNKEIYKFSDGNYFQTIEWANYKFNYGWETYRFIAQDRKEKIPMSPIWISQRSSVP